MRIPDSLASLIDDGIIDEVVRPLMSGKEAQVFLVLSGGEERVAKVYKEAHARTFKHRAAYTEGRRVKNSRDQRAMDSRSRHGRAKEEAAWRSAEVDMIYRLHYAGVRVPIPHNFSDGVLVMELLKDERGFPAPRLGDVSLHRDEAVQVFELLMHEVVKMLCAGVVHGDLSDFNVLMSDRGPVVIDFPQAMNAASNQNARTILVRDVANLYRFLARFVPGQRPMRHAEEMWELFQRGELRPETVLTGQYRATARAADTTSLLRELDAVNRDESKRRAALGKSQVGLPPIREDRPDPRAPRPDARAPRSNEPRRDAQMPPAVEAAPRRRMVENAPAAPVRRPQPQQARSDEARSHGPRRDERPAPPRQERPAAHREERPAPYREQRTEPVREERPAPPRQERFAPHREERPASVSQRDPRGPRAEGPADARARMPLVRRDDAPPLAPAPHTAADSQASPQDPAAADAKARRRRRRRRRPASTV